MQIYNGNGDKPSTVDDSLPTSNLNLVPTVDMDQDQLEKYGISYDTASAPKGTFVVYGLLPGHTKHGTSGFVEKSKSNWNEAADYIASRYGGPGTVDPSNGIASKPGVFGSIPGAGKGFRWAFRVATQASIDIANPTN
jgi:hypothetical protein